MAVLSITLRSDRSEIPRLGALVEQFGAEHHLTDESVMNVNLVLDEIVANIIRHANLERADRIHVLVSFDGVAVTIEVADPGVAFNPVEAPSPNLDAPIEDRRGGGLGIHIVKSLAETVAYRRVGGRNCFSATVRVERS